MNPFRVKELSSREKQVFALRVGGFSTGEIAQQLTINPRTVSTYLIRIAEKKGYASVKELNVIFS